MNFKPGDYRTTAVASTILRWLKRGYTIEQIRKAAGEINVSIEDIELEKALIMLEQWKKEHPKLNSYRCYKNKRTENKEDGGR